MKIVIKDKEIELKYSFRSLMMYENITGHTLNQANLTDVITFIYCVILSSSKDYSITFDDVIDYIDENPSLIGEFGEWLNKTIEVNDALKKN